MTIIDMEGRGRADYALQPIAPARQARDFARSKKQRRL